WSAGRRRVRGGTGGPHPADVALRGVASAGAPVALDPDVAALAWRPAARHPDVARLGRHFPVAGHPDVVVAVPAPVTRDPHVRRAGRHRRDLDPDGWRRRGAPDDHRLRHDAAGHEQRDSRGGQEPRDLHAPFDGARGPSVYPGGEPGPPAWTSQLRGRRAPMSEWLTPPPRPIAEAITGREDLGDLSRPEQAVAQFYRAFNGRDLAGLAASWEPSEEAVMNN